jgi:hypothetical protein
VTWKREDERKDIVYGNSERWDKRWSILKKGWKKG